MYSLRCTLKVAFQWREPGPPFVPQPRQERDFTLNCTSNCTSARLCADAHFGASPKSAPRFGRKMPAPARETVVHNLTLSRSDTEIAVF
jgi:hypothetical protein